MDSLRQQVQVHRRDGHRDNREERDEPDVRQRQHRERDHQDEVRRAQPPDPDYQDHERHDGQHVVRDRVDLDFLFGQIG